MHLHAGGQGVWVARMAAELRAHPILCSFVGGETGQLLRPLLEQQRGELRAVHTTASCGCYVVDRRAGAREVIATAWSAPSSRHEVDDLFSIACAAALASRVLVVCGPVPPDSLPLELYRNLVADARANGSDVIVDLAPRCLDSALDAGPSMVKLNDWQLAEYVSGSVDQPGELRAGAERVLGAGAECVIVTRGGEPALVLREDRAWELVPPRFDGGAPEGSGDSMVGAMAAALARGIDWEQSLRWGAAAGAANFLRHGLGTGSGDVVGDLLHRVELRSL